MPDLVPDRFSLQRRGVFFRLAEWLAVVVVTLYADRMAAVDVTPKLLANA